MLMRKLKGKGSRHEEEDGAENAESAKPEASDTY
jgi:hypothetical protein